MNCVPETDILNIIYFDPESKEFAEKQINIYRLIKTQEIRFVVSYSKMKIYMLLDIDINYFISVDLLTLEITEEKISSKIGFAPSLNLINEKYIIAIGGINCDTINLFNLETSNWTYIGKMRNARYGAYTLYDNIDNIIYIIGGRDNEQNNELELEYFTIPDDHKSKNSFLNPKDNQYEINTKKFSSDFSLRRSFPIAFQLYGSNDFIVCGGNGLFLDEDINTSTIVDVTGESCRLLQDLHKEFSSKNPNVLFNSNIAYFFIKEEEVIKFNCTEHTFSSIKKKKEIEEES